ncbi:MAG TPA: cytochrome c oxidase subunit II [Gaiellaceae bacterium]|nr:cytochrome c oxidase subunit II [Gaiellaceae bacterium]
MTARVRHRGRLALPAGLLALVLTGCDEQQDALAPRSHAAKDIASLFWWMMGVAWFGLAIVVALMVVAWRKAHRRPGHEPKEGEAFAFKVVIGAGIVFPIALIATLFVIGDIFVIGTTQAPARGATQLTVDVIGHQWWWEVRYPGTSAVTANEIHIPVRTPVRVQVSTADVIHSFWVPRLNRTIDTIPGKTNAIELYADAVGRYRGQCDEFCGLQHAHMSFYVFADPPAVFQRWLRDQEKPAAATRSAGATLFAQASCANCHAIRGTSASGYVGPDLTHVASRTTLASLTIPNDRNDLVRWITHAQEVKPGNQMPDIRLTNAQVQTLATYLESLR